MSNVENAVEDRVEAWCELRVRGGEPEQVSPRRLPLNGALKDESDAPGIGVGGVPDSLHRQAVDVSREFWDSCEVSAELVGSQ